MVCLEVVGEQAAEGKVETVLCRTAYVTSSGELYRQTNRCPKCNGFKARRRES